MLEGVSVATLCSLTGIMLWNWNLNSKHIELGLSCKPSQVVLKFMADTPNENKRTAKPLSRIFILRRVQYQNWILGECPPHLSKLELTFSCFCSFSLCSSALLLLQHSSLNAVAHLCLNPDSDSQIENMCKKGLWEIPEACWFVICKH